MAITNHDRAIVCSRAHEIRREAAVRFNCRIPEISLSICFEQAWREYHSRTILPRDISLPFSPYDNNRCSRPWGATISIYNGEAHYEFSGRFRGTYREGGEVVIPNVRIGQIVAFGQKDYYMTLDSLTMNQWFVVRDDFSLYPIDRDYTIEMSCM